MATKMPTETGTGEIETFGSKCQYRYSCTDFIGRGRFGIVYKAIITERHDYIGEEMVAVKAVHLDKDSEIVMNGQNWVKTRRKLRRLLRLVHQHLVRFHQIRITKSAGGTIVEIVMEHCTSDLTSLLKQAQERKAVLKYEDVERFSREITTGLGFLHRREIIHGDLKPGNILVKRVTDGEALLLIGDLDDLIPMQESVTCSGDFSQLCGTVRYMSPEILKKFCQLDAPNPGRKTDIWSLGCIMLELAECLAGITNDERLLELNGKQINMKENVQNTQFAGFIMEGYVPFVSAEIPRKLADWIRLCLQQNPEERTSAEALWKKFPGVDPSDINKDETIPVTNLNVLIMNRNSTSGVIDKTVILDPVTNRFRLLEVPMPEKVGIMIPSLPLPNDEILLQADMGDSGQTDRLYIWNTSKGTWRSFTFNTESQSTRWCSPVVVKNMIYYFRWNGFHNFEFVAESMLNCRIKFQEPCRVDGWRVRAITQFEEKILYAHNTWANDCTFLELYDPTADQWDSLPELPQRRLGFSMVVVGRSVYIIGGSVDQVATASCVRLNSRTATWELIDPMQQPRHFHSACAVGKKIYVCGGTDTNGTAADLIEVYDTAIDESWSSVPMPAQDPLLHFVLQRTVLGLGATAIAVPK